MEFRFIILYGNSKHCSYWTASVLQDIKLDTFYTKTKTNTVQLSVRAEEMREGYACQSA